MRLSDDDLAALAASLAGSLYGTLCVEAEGFSAVLTRDGAGWHAETTLRTETSLTLEPGVEADVAADHMGPAVRGPVGGNILSRAQAGGSALRGARQRGDARNGGGDHRNHEAHELGPCRA